MNKRIIVLSSSYMCIDAELSAIPTAGREADGGPYRITPGGKGLTAALTFRALGLDSIFCTAVGDDLYGDQLIAFFDRTGIDRRFVKRCRRTKTGLYLSLYEKDRAKRYVRFPQANTMLERADVEAMFMAYPDALYIQSELPYELTAFAVNLARSKGVPVFYHPCAFADKPGKTPPGGMEAVILDDAETASFCGIKPDEYDKFLPSAMALASRIKAKYYIIRLPERGTFIYDGIHHEMVGEYPSTYIDETGAAVVYGAAFTAAYLKTDGNAAKAAKCAAAAYAYSSSNRGDITSVPSASDVAAYIKKDG